MKLTYQAQAQQQQQDPGEAPATTGNPADGPVPDGFGDDAIIGDILGKPAPADDDGADQDEPPPRKKPVQEEEEPEDPTPPDDDPDDDEDALEIPDDPDEEDEFEEAAESDGKVTGKLAEARAARKAGDIDKAIMLAFGCKPEELQPNNHVWTQWRAANKREDKRRADERQAFEGEVAKERQSIQSERINIHHTIEALKPYEELQRARVAFKRDGDPAHIVAIVEGLTEMPYNEAQKIVLTKTRRSPEAIAMQRQIAELEKKLQDTLGEREKQNEQQTAAQAYAADLDYIRGQVSGVVTKVPKFAERIYNIMVKTKGPLGPTKTPQQAAELVLRAERKRLAEHPFIRKPGKGKAGKVPAPVSDAARRLAQRRKNAAGGPPLRRDSQNNGAKNRDTETDDDIILDILGKGGARRAG